MADISLDYGHGGSDSGATGFGLLEKERTLYGGKKLKAILERCGFSVHETRSDDSTHSLGDRCNSVNASGSKLVISYHFNAGGGQGFEVYHSVSSPPMQRGNLVANLINDEVKKFFNSRGVKTKVSTSGSGDYYTMISGTNPVALITEGCFIDNQGDNDKLKSDAWLKQYNEAIAKGVCAYFGKTFVPEPAPVQPSTPAPQPQKSGLYKVQCGAYREKGNAEALAKQLSQAGFNNFIVFVED